MLLEAVGPNDGLQGFQKIPSIELEATHTSLRANIVAARELLYWRKTPKGQDAEQQRHLDELSAEKLNRDHMGLHEGIGDVPSLLRAVMQEKESLVLRRQAALFEKLKSAKGTHDSLQTNLAIYRGIIKEKTALVARIETLLQGMGGVGLDAAQSVARGHTGLALEALQLYLMAGRSLGAAEVTRGMQEQIRVITPQLPDPLPEVDVSLIVGNDPEFEYFSKYFSGVGYYIGNNNEYTALGNEIARDFGQKIGTILNAAHMNIQEVVEGRAAVNVDQILNGHLASLVKLEKDLQAKRLTFSDSPLHAYVESLFAYVSGCTFALQEARDLLLLAKEIATPYSQQVFRVYNAAERFFATPPLQPYETANRAFTWCLEAKKLEEEHLVKPQDPFVACALERIKTSVDKFYRAHVKVSLEYTPAEETLHWDAVMQSEVEGPPLAPRLGAYLLNRATKALFFQEAEEIVVDSELEMLFANLQQQGKLEGTLAFTDMLDRYTMAFQGTRSDVLLQEAAQLIARMYPAEEFDMLRYAKLYQDCFNFMQASKDKNRKSIGKLIFKKLDIFAQKREFPGIHEKFYLWRMSEWVTKIDPNDHDPGYTLLSAVEMVDFNLRTGVVKSFLLRALAACLYGKDEQEKKFAQEHITNICEDQAYEYYRGRFSDNIKRLLYENTATKIIERAPVGYNEAGAFMAGPINDFMQQPSIPLSYNRLPHALYRLLVRERLVHDKGPLQERFEQAKGEKTFKKWLKHYRMFEVSSSADRKFYASIVQQNGADGKPLPIPQHVLVDLEAKFGQGEARKLIRYATRNAIFTQELVLGRR
jgi:hypothetical protein